MNSYWGLERVELFYFDEWNLKNCFSSLFWFKEIIILYYKFSKSILIPGRGGIFSEERYLWIIKKKKRKKSCIYINIILILKLKRKLNICNNDDLWKNWSNYKSNYTCWLIFWFLLIWIYIYIYNCYMFYTCNNTM